MSTPWNNSNCERYLEIFQSNVKRQKRADLLFMELGGCAPGPDCQPAGEDEGDQNHPLHPAEHRPGRRYGRDDGCSAGTLMKDWITSTKTFR